MIEAKVTFGLIHGGGLGSWSWDRVRAILDSAGHATVAPDLPLDHAGLEEITDIAASAISARPANADIVVVGHALGCAALPLIADRTSATRMIWVCGVIPEPGKSCADQIAADPTMVPMYGGREFARGSSEQGRDNFLESLLHDCDPDQRAWAEGHMRKVPDRRRRTVTNAATDKFPVGVWPSIPSGYIVCSDDRALSPAWSKEMASRRLGVDAVELPGGHCPLISRPDELASAVLAILGTDDR